VAGHARPERSNRQQPGAGMIFSNAALLGILAPLLGLPLLIHLFNRRFPHLLYFPDIQRIRRSLSERSTLARWRHILMTLLRTALLAALLVAFLKPVWPKLQHQELSAGPRPQRRVILIVDHSLSMEHRTGGGTSAARNARVEAAKILAALTPGDEANAILVGANAEAVTPEFTTQSPQILRALETAGPGYERADVGKGIALAASLLDRQSVGRAEVYFLSDFQRSNWADVSFAALSKNTQVFFVDVANNRERANTALLSVKPAAGQLRLHEGLRLNVEFGNFTAQPVTSPVEAIMDGVTSSHGVVTAPAWSTGRVELTLGPLTAGIHTIEARTPEDDLPADNHRYLQIGVQQRETVWLVSDKADATSARFIATALDPFEDGSGAFSARQVAPGAITPSQFSGSSRVIVTETQEWPAALSDQLSRFLEQGGGVLYFLNGSADRQNLEALDRVLGRPVMPLHLAGRMTAENFSGGSLQFAKGDFQSRFLKLFRGANRQALGRLEFYEAQRALTTGQGHVLLSFNDGAPAIAEAQVGLGVLVLCNFGPQELSSNLARQRLFPAWIQELVKNLTPEEPELETHEVGFGLSAEVWHSDLDQQKVVGPDGKDVLIKSTPIGERTLFSFRPALPGIYRLGAPGHLTWAAAVDPPTEESDLRGMDPEELSRRAGEGRAEQGLFLNGAQDYAEVGAGRPLYQWFVLGAATLFLLEMLLLPKLQRRARRPA